MARNKAAKRKRKPRGQSQQSADKQARTGAESTRYRREPVFGREFMLFRVLVITGLSMASAANGEMTAAAVAAALAAGTATQHWERCGEDGKDGTQGGHSSDSRVHRYGREVGFLRDNQQEIDSDPRSKAVYEQLRNDPNKMRSHQKRVDQWSLFERYTLAFHSSRPYAQFLRDCESGGSLDGSRLKFRVRYCACFPRMIVCLRVTSRAELALCVPCAGSRCGHRGVLHEDAPLWRGGQ